VSLKFEYCVLSYSCDQVVGNPQTFHQALLLMASLARLAPESVLHNVMPVFTFMGSNVFHRDDTYSFRVIQKVRASPLDIPVDLIEEWYADDRRYCTSYGCFSQERQCRLPGLIYRLKRFSSSVYGCCESYTTPPQK